MVSEYFIGVCTITDASSRLVTVIISFHAFSLGLGSVSCKIFEKFLHGKLIDEVNILKF
jgi:hypothetical protein